MSSSSASSSSSSYDPFAAAATSDGSSSSSSSSSSFRKRRTFTSATTQAAKRRQEPIDCSWIWCLTLTRTREIADGLHLYRDLHNGIRDLINKQLRLRGNKEAIVILREIPATGFVSSYEEEGQAQDNKRRVSEERMYESKDVALVDDQSVFYCIAKNQVDTRDCDATVVRGHLDSTALLTTISCSPLFIFIHVSGNNEVIDEAKVPRIRYSFPYAKVIYIRDFTDRSVFSEYNMYMSEDERIRRLWRVYERTPEYMFSPVAVDYQNEGARYVNKLDSKTDFLLPSPLEGDTPVPRASIPVDEYKRVQRKLLPYDVKKTNHGNRTCYIRDPQAIDNTLVYPHIIHDQNVRMREVGGRGVTLFNIGSVFVDIQENRDAIQELTQYVMQYTDVNENWTRNAIMDTEVEEGRTFDVAALADLISEYAEPTYETHLNEKESDGFRGEDDEYFEVDAAIDLESDESK